MKMEVEGDTEVECPKCGHVFETHVTLEIDPPERGER